MKSSQMLLAVDFGQGISEAWTSVAKFVPKFIAFLIILLVGWIIAKLISKAVDVVLERVGFDKVVERGGIKRALAKSQYDASDIIAKLIYYAILLIALQIAFSVFGPNPISELLRGVVAWIPKAVVAIIIVVIVAAIANAVRTVISAALGGVSYGKTLANLAAVLIIGLGVIAALNQIGVAVTVTNSVLVAVLATVAGILIVGVGGGLVKPMQSRWDGWLRNAEQEAASLRATRAGGESGGRGGTPPSGDSDGSTAF